MQVDRVVKAAFGTLAFLQSEHRVQELEHHIASVQVIVETTLGLLFTGRSPTYRKDVIKLERNRKRFITMFLGMENLNYDRLGSFFPWSVGG